MPIRKASIHAGPDYPPGSCAPLMRDGAGNTISIWLCFCSAVASMCCGFWLAVCCARLRRRHPEEMFIYLLMWIGIADVLLAIWQSFLDVAAMSEHDLDCNALFFLQRALVMLTTLDALALAVGMVLQLCRGATRIPRLLWWAPWLAMPLSVAMSLVYLLVEDVVQDENFMELCYSNGLGSHVYIVEVSAIFAITVVLHVFVIGQAWQTAPRSVSRRSVANACRYLLALFLTHVLHVFYKIWLWTDRAPFGSCGFEILRVVGNMCLNLNGFFNFLAFWIHARRVARRRNAKVGAHVHFRGDGSLREECQIPYGEEARKSNPIQRHSMEAQDWLEDELGHCLGDLYSTGNATTDTDMFTTETDAEYSSTNGVTSSDGFIAG